MDASNHQDSTTKSKSERDRNSASSQSTTVAASSDQGKTKEEKKKVAVGSNARVARWGHWTDWSACSVSCGKGRQIRWRHCLKHCDEAETEMEEKTCQLPACGPSKLFGVIKLR